MLTLENVGKTYAGPGGGTVAIGSVSAAVGKGEFVALLGPSGCGKTTLLRAVAGIERPTAGSIRLHHEPIDGPDRRRGMVFQHFSLFPWLTVEENIAFGLKIRRAPQAEIAAAVDHYLALTGLGQFRKSYPGTLSGGMQQRLAIARTLANRPEILLLDEPFGSLDAQTRSAMQEFLAALTEREGNTVLLVTHDVEEALFLADRVLVMSGRPARIIEDIRVPFAHPRTHDLKRSQEFFTLKNRATALLE